MNKEEIEKAKGHLEWLLDNGILASEDEPHIENILEYIEYLEQKESILDKVTEECMKQMTTYEDSILEIFPQRILNIIEGEKK